MSLFHKAAFNLVLTCLNTRHPGDLSSAVRVPGGSVLMWYGYQTEDKVDKRACFVSYISLSNWLILTAIHTYRKLFKIRTGRNCAMVCQWWSDALVNDIEKNSIEIHIYFNVWYHNDVENNSIEIHI